MSIQLKPYVPDASGVLYSPLFFDADVDVILFSDVDLDAEPVDAVGKVPEEDNKVTILDNDVVVL